MSTLVTFALTLLSAVLVFYILAVGKAILVPLVIAVFVWYLINAITEGFKRFLPVRRCIRLLLSVLTVIGVIWYPVELIHQTIPEVLRAAPAYQDNIRAMLQELLSWLNLEQATVVTTVTETLDFGKLARMFAKALADFAGNAVLITLYVIFLLLEQGSFAPKMAAIFSGNGQQAKAQHVVADVYQRVQTYVWIKTLMSVLTAVCSYALMASVGLDFAGFWAVLIFFLNYIPNIGSVIATVFPALLALVQFDASFVPFFVIVGGITALQFVMGNVIEPRLMGNSLNLSPLVILLSLVVWGSLWGVAGMFLCVPMTVIAVIIFAKIPRTRSIAILLSNGGKIS